MCLIDDNQSQSIWEGRAVVDIMKPLAIEEDFRAYVNKRVNTILNIFSRFFIESEFSKIYCSETG